MTLVKICGLTNYKDAMDAINLGADFIGLNFYTKVPRYIRLKEARKIAENTPKKAKKVGIFVNSTLNNIKKISKDIDLDYIQLHGNESPKFCKEVKKATKKKVIKALRIKNKNDLIKIKKFDVDYLMFDAYKKGHYGGTGKIIDFNLLKGIKKNYFLSGGLNPTNVKKAIKRLKPYVVDTSSGVEKSLGKKDYKKIKLFIEAAK
jgi:phosphoribosylanthranilate isomerase|tara:strand:+ start:1357 stop:1968 length:612 start_codon:yes stop_codon:yes gene_type:complete